MDLTFLIELPFLFFSIIVHEYSHGAVAERFGDDTARVMGRLTFNPLPHIDPMGTILLPALCLMTNTPMFGWAKPVPVNLSRLRGQPMSLLFVAASGPVSNIVLACLSVLGLGIVLRFIPALASNFFAMRLAQYAIIVNLYLAVFNLLPIHPLDGSNIVSSLLPYPWRSSYDRLAPYGFFIIMILIYTGLFNRIVSPVVYTLYNVLIRAIS
ncbi:MAG: site-2 protease family protein [Elusimicrobia bacterium]|nr:site-2 protease family protein [Elusimicrobiota bacterium]